MGDDDWGSLFDDAAVDCSKKKILLLLDEIARAIGRKRSDGDVSEFLEDL